jgi:hypothetical protein
MSIRKHLASAALAVLALAPLPALAHEEPQQGSERDIARRLSDPRNQIGATVAMTAFVETLLNMNIEPMRRALDATGSDAAADLPPDARLRDVVPGADRLPGEIGRRVPQTMGAAAGMAGAIEDMIPEFKATYRRMKSALPKHHQGY